MRSIEVMTGLLLIVAAPAAGSPQGPPGPTAEIVIPAPEPRRFVLALDEIELDWTKGKRSGQVDRQGVDRPEPATVPGTKVLRHERERTRVRVEGATSREALRRALSATLAANPGARGEVIVYEAGRAKTEVNRQLLTSDVAMILNDAVLLEDVLARAKMIRAELEEVHGGYVIRCETPFAALDVAQTLSTLEGVKHAYPLVKRTRVTR